MTDRKNAPKFNEIKDIKILEAELKTLDNNIPVHVINAGTQDIVKLDLIFEAGIWFQSKMVQASTTSSLLNSGSKNYTEMQIAEKVDYYGAYLDFNVDRDFAHVTLYTLKKYFAETIKILDDIIKNPIFSEDEFNTLINKKKQQFIVDNSKVKTVAGREFAKLLFGANHPYGVMAELKDFDNIKISDLKQFHKDFYTPDNCKIIISGKIDKDVFNQLNSYLGNNWNGKRKATDNEFILKTSKQKENIFVKDDAVQSALRIGRVMFSRNHPDYVGIQVLNTVLGGYFGSRLMKNIREDKGYTYGIGSVVLPMRNNGYFAIVSEVNATVCKDAVSEIYKEISLLRDELISNDELQLVKNYIKGDLIKSFDGPFAIADKYKLLVENNLTSKYFEEFVTGVNNITNKDLIKLAQKYLSTDGLIDVIAGKC